mmetsp:Transcript_2647/g.2763  ORF Transcript_2647/g.2763 Transcript_2647/m.2763 type:complete len:182 (+) Transcript_2647:170-715(+)|eukprot:CAMPEP_0119042300 /NCGR_PEP_ID=MMETSP1177-20130426/14529_1 /TAXON_ID=2985 /ORGANISM="Ochromonas sp, Strain CCMP1899" /LENGTH=181 /DNA_ID=CAMNT_0007008981 /DNA_START=131 /DNA_END=676 /DNA_ORIENTATION=+
MSDSECEGIVAALKKCGINFLAIDFDETLICEHTGGHWRGSLADLASKVRPFFRRLVPLVMKSDILIAIVTFSGQVSIISAVLHREFGLELASKITIRGQDNSWEYRGKGSADGKQGHMASAAEELGDANHQVITRNTTLLLDDDAENIRVALVNKVRAVRYLPSNQEVTIAKLLELKDLY